MTIEEIQKRLEALGVPADRSRLCAVQLDKRADQLRHERNMERDEAENYLLELMSQGWVAQPPPAKE